jgi:homoserine kinase
MTSERRRASVRVPASSANLGAGFDCIGIAVDRWLTASVEAGDDLDSNQAAITISRDGTLVSLDLRPEDDVLYAGFAAACAARDRSIPKRLVFSADSDIPVARGLGSSSAALVAGARLADAALSLELGDTAIAELCSRIEGHPDNVAPSVFGGAILGVSTGSENKRWTFASLSIDAGIAFVFAIPPYPVDTAIARGLLPLTVDHAIAVRAAAKSAALVEGLRTGDRTLLEIALDDVLHVPYRRHLVPGLAGLHEAARAAGAYGITLSGSGPTLVAIAPQDQADRVADAIRNRWMSEGVVADSFVQRRPAAIVTPNHQS